MIMFRHLAVACAIVLLVAGCSLFRKEEPRSCPRVSLLNDATRITLYRDGPGRDLTDVVTEARVDIAAVGCKYDDRHVTVIAQITFRAQRGPAATGREADLPFFVAITDSGQDVLAKQEFATRIEFPEGQSRAGVIEEMEQRIPLPDPKTSGPGFEILVGFQLTEKQLEENRGRRR